jgi:uncharacterized protein YukE
MTNKALLIITAVVVVVLSSFTTFAQEGGQEAAAKGSGKAITYGDLQTQKEKIEGLRTSYAQAITEFDDECTGKSESMEDYQKCYDKRTQLTNIYNELKKEVEAYNKNIEQYRANNAKRSPDTTGPSTQGKGK